MHPVLEMFRKQFDELLNKSPLRLGESEAHINSYRNRFVERGTSSSSAGPAPLVVDLSSRSRRSGPSVTVLAQAARIPPLGARIGLGPEYSSDPSPYAHVYYAGRSEDAAVCEVDEVLHRELQPYVVFGSKFRVYRNAIQARMRERRRIKKLRRKRRRRPRSDPSSQGQRLTEFRFNLPDRFNQRHNGFRIAFC